MIINREYEPVVEFVLYYSWATTSFNCRYCTTVAQVFCLWIAEFLIIAILTSKGHETWHKRCLDYFMTTKIAGVNKPLKSVAIHWVANCKSNAHLRTMAMDSNIKALWHLPRVYLLTRLTNESSYPAHVVQPPKRLFRHTAHITNINTIHAHQQVWLHNLTCHQTATRNCGINGISINLWDWLTLRYDSSFLALYKNKP